MTTFSSGILSDWQLEVVFNNDYHHKEYSDKQMAFYTHLIENGLRCGTITPFYNGVRVPKSTSTGLSGCGYDICIDGSVPLECYLPIDKDEVVDPLNFDSSVLTKITSQLDADGRPIFLVPPSAYCLASSLEYFDIPDWVVGVATGKSTYARAACKLNITPLEPGWKGHLVIEFYNASNRTLIIYPNMGFAQVLFHDLGGKVDKCYTSKNGRYQNQEKGVVYARA